MEYIETLSGNKVSRRSTLSGSQNIVLQGRSVVSPGCIVRGDLASVRVGRHVVLHDAVVLRPPMRRTRKGAAHIPQTVGDCVEIGADSVVEAAQVGSFVRIGRNCTIGARCVLYDCCEVADGAVLPDDMVVPPHAYAAGSPARLVPDRELPEATSRLQRQRCIQAYEAVRN